VEGSDERPAFSVTAGRLGVGVWGRLAVGDGLRGSGSPRAGGLPPLRTMTPDSTAIITDSTPPVPDADRQSPLDARR